MNKIFETQFLTGSLVDKLSGVIMTNTNGSFKEAKKGKIWRGGGNNSNINTNRLIDINDYNGIISVEAWIRFSTSQANTYIVEQWNLPNFQFILWISTITNKISFNIWDGSNQSAISNDTLNDNKWHHVIGIADGTNVHLYIDNVLQTSIDTYDSSNIPTPTETVNIGSNGTGAREFIGDIGKITLFNTSITDGERDMLYNKFLKSDNLAQQKVRPVDYNEIGDITTTNHVVLLEDLRFDSANFITESYFLGYEKYISSGTFKIEEDSTGKYIECVTNGTFYYNIDLDDYTGNGFIKELIGDLNGDEGDTISNATNLSYSNNKLTITMTNGQILRKLVITKGAT